MGFSLGLSACSGSSDEEPTPAGFTPEDTTAATGGPGVFVADGDRIVTATLADRLLRRQAAGEDNDGPSADLSDDARLEADLGSTYAQGVRVSLSRRPRAFVEFRPLGAQQAQARLRSDGALVSFDEAYPGVTAAFGGSTRKLKEFLRVPDPGHLPALRYEVRKGPDFGELRAGGAGELWAYDADGGPLFEVLAPQVKDAHGTVVSGSWELSEQGGVTVANASLNFDGLVYPLLIDPSFDTPTWFFDFYNEPPGRGAAAFTWSRSKSAAVVFGGGTGSSFQLLNDTRIRRVKGGTNHWVAGDITALDPSKPSPRAYAALAPHEESGKVYLFGGYTPRISDELWALSFTGNGTDADWTQITPSSAASAWPTARFFHGMVALSNREILLFGGVDGQGNLLKDTWMWNGSAWTQVCHSCFPGLYGFTTVPGRGTQRGIPIVIGGYNGQLTSAAYQWNPTTSTWNQVSIADAAIPTNEAGSITRDASEGTVSPLPRYAAFGFRTPTGSILYGGGITSIDGAEARLSDAWQWVKPGSEDVWRRQTGPNNLWLPGRRESPVALLVESADRMTPSFGLLFGGVSDGAGDVIQQTRLYRGFDDQVALSVGKTDTDYVLRAAANLGGTIDMDRLGAYFVRRVLTSTGATWEKLSGCGSSTAPLRGASASGSSIMVSCSTPISANGRTTAFGVLARDQAFYTTPTGGRSEQCTVSMSSRGTALCGLSSAFPAQAVCGLPSGASYECAAPLARAVERGEGGRGSGGRPRAPRAPSRPRPDAPTERSARRGAGRLSRG